MALSKINREELERLTEALIKHSTRQLNDNKNNNEFSHYVDKLITVTHLFPTNYIGIDGQFGTNDIKKLWYYFRHTRNINIDKYPISEEHMKIVNQYTEEDEDILNFLVPYFEKLVAKRGLVNIMTVHLSGEELKQYTELIKLVQGTENVNISTDIFPELTDVSIDKKTLTDQIHKLTEYNTSYLMISNPISYPYTISQISDNHKDTYDTNEDIYTLVKVINLPF
jgi:hypothetical protein